MNFFGKTFAPLGMGCWPIGGAMFSGDQPLGYSNTTDAESIRTLHAAYASGITLFDTAAAYGAGHAERLIAQALKGKDDAVIVTKIGIGIDEETKQLTGDEIAPSTVQPAIDRCLKRMERDHVDLVLLHQNALPVEQAVLIFDEMEKARENGKISAYGWSTDFHSSAKQVAEREHFKSVEFVTSVLVDAPEMHKLVADKGLLPLIRSPLAMGLLGGKYGKGSTIPDTDIRSTTNMKVSYFEDAKPNPALLKQLDAVRDLLTSDGRSLVQGALCWLWGKSPSHVPIPGVRTVEQVEQVAEALTFGALPQSVMGEIETLIGTRVHEGEERAR